MNLKPTGAFALRAPAANDPLPAAANDDAPPAVQGVGLSIITSPNTLSKTMRWRDGKLVKKAAAETSRSKVEQRTVTGASGFAEVLKSLTPKQALTYGLSDKGDCELYSRDRYARLPEQSKQTASTRTKDRFHFTPGPGVMMLDYDPRAGGDALAPDALRAAIVGVLPELVECATVQWLSSSSNIFDAGGHLLQGVRGQRIYMLVKDARDIPRAGGVLADRLWLAGYGYFDVSRSGALLERCLVDTSVWQSNRLDFAAGADCHDGLTQDRGEPVVREGALLDTATALPDVDAAEAARLRTLKAEARTHAEPEAAAKQVEWVEARAKVEVESRPDAAELEPDERRAALHEARARARRAVSGGVLDGEFVVTVVDEAGEPQPVTVAELLRNRAKYNDRRTLDPLEPEYGDGRAVGYLRLRGGRPDLYSHAHGGKSYSLVNAPHRIVHARGNTQGTTDETLAYLRGADILFDRGTELTAADASGLHAVKGAALGYILAKHIQYVQAGAPRKGKPAETAIDPPQGVLQQLAAVERGLKQVNAAITAPVLAGTGRVVREYGHDAETGLFVCGDFSGMEIPDAVSEADALAALDVLWHPFREFDCATALDKGVLLAAILTAIQRPALPTAPGFALDAPTQGTGKTYLAQCLGALAQGETPTMTAPPDVSDEAEMGKHLLSTALEAPAVIVWDNVTGTLSSGKLASFLTTEAYEDRVLGESRTATVTTRALFLLTGNNVSLAGDLPRRVLKCRLDAKSENPATRTFHDNPLADIRQRRTALVQTGLTLIRGYQQSGWMPVGNTASFEVWDRCVRQCCAWVASLRPEYQDPGDAIAEAQAADPEREELGELLDSLIGAMDTPGIKTGDDGWFTAADVMKVIEAPAGEAAAALRLTLRALCMREVSPKGIGRALTFRKDRRIGARCLRAKTPKGHSTRFRVEVGLV